eukprot:TRINITY_DN2798_c0_g1_i1.p1 TRINITY_DN2798_c0_g1~~TRINITY_DN2798_c0_g1_i1.p1  ORF type:complete len:504 (-),score=100.74 TRINITY_DN2798_c0_g1_i1:1363-2874(-)
MATEEADAPQNDSNLVGLKLEANEIASPNRTEETLALLAKEVAEIKTIVATLSSRLDVLELEKTKHHTSNGINSNKHMGQIVTLNVGGQIFTTTRATLCIHGDSMLNKMVSGTYSESTDAKGNIFIDRSPQHFDVILNFLRSGKILLPETLRDTIDLKDEFDYYNLPFPDEAFIRFPKAYSLERVFGEVPIQPEFWDISKNYLLCAEYKETEYLAYVINFHTGKRVGKVIDLQSHIEQGFQCGLTGYGTTIWTYNRKDARLVIIDMISGYPETIHLNKISPTISWKSCSVLTHFQSTSILCMCDESEPDTRKVACLFDIQRKKLILLDAIRNRPLHTWCPLLYDDVFVCILLKSDDNTKHLCACDIKTGKALYERQSYNMRKIACGDLLLRVDGCGSGCLVDPKDGCVVGSFNALNLQNVLGRKLKATDAISCFGRSHMVIWPRDSSDLLIFELCRNAPICHLKDLLPHSNIGSLAHIFQCGNKLISCCYSPNHLMVLAPRCN